MMNLCIRTGYTDTYSLHLNIKITVSAEHNARDQWMWDKLLLIGGDLFEWNVHLNYFIFTFE